MFKLIKFLKHVKQKSNKTSFEKISSAIPTTHNTLVYFLALATKTTFS